MNLASVLLGLAGIALGVNTLKTGARRLADGMAPAPGRGVPAGVRVVPGARVPTVVVPRSATRKMPPVISKGVRTKTLTGDMRVTTHEVRSLNDRLAAIIDLAHQGKLDPRVIAWARREVSRRKPGSTAWNGEQWAVPEKDSQAEIIALFKAMRRDVRYTSDVRGADTFSRPNLTLSTGAEDCDGYAALGCAALMSIGLSCRLEVIQTKDSDTPNHIFVSGSTDKADPNRGKWIALDASVPMPPGWQAPDSMVARRWIYETE